MECVLGPVFSTVVEHRTSSDVTGRSNVTENVMGPTHWGGLCPSGEGRSQGCRRREEAGAGGVPGLVQEPGATSGKVCLAPRKGRVNSGFRKSSDNNNERPSKIVPYLPLS